MRPDPVFAALLAAAPATYAWWTGRRILRSLEDPALAELLHTRQRRVAQVTVVAIVASGVFGSAVATTIVMLTDARRRSTLLLSIAALRGTAVAWTVASSYRDRSIAIVDVARRTGLHAVLPPGDVSYASEMSVASDLVAAWSRAGADRGSSCIASSRWSARPRH